MERGIHVAGGDRIGKTIIFAQNKRHAEYILERFNKLYPMYKGTFAQRIICDDSYAQSIIEAFKVPDKEPHIAVSVDMMDTGIDVPECVNLVFFKKVRSKTKFWQMIGRGTRLAPELTCIDSIDGEYTGKKRFLIFDYCGNFEFFRQHKEGYESADTKSLTENIFGKQVRLMTALQEDAFAEEKYQQFRSGLVDICFGQVAQLSYDIVSVRLQKELVEKYQKKEAFQQLEDTDKLELMRNIAPLVHLDDQDEAAKRFDNFMYGMMIAHIEAMPSFNHARQQLCLTAELLEKKSAIPQIAHKLPVIRQIETDEFWDAKDILLFEMVRRELRDLIQFIEDGGNKRIIETAFTDVITDMQEGQTLEAAYDFEDYRKKVNRYVNEHGDTMAIFKLTHNIPLSSGDYNELERVLTSELGSREDYIREYGETPFGLLIRKIAKLDHDAALQAFSAYINDAKLNERQIAFVRKIILHIEQNGYMENLGDLQKPPFDKPISFIKMFDPKTRASLMKTIREITENATNIIA